MTSVVHLDPDLATHVLVEPRLLWLLRGVATYDRLRIYA